MHGTRRVGVCWLDWTSRKRERDQSRSGKAMMDPTQLLAIGSAVDDNRNWITENRANYSLDVH